MKTQAHRVALAAAFSCFFQVVPGTAQPETAASASSNGSLRPIPVSDQFFSKSIWRAVDLREKQNKPLFAEGHEISRIIIEAVKRGDLQAYRNDSLTSTLTRQQVSANMSFVEEGPQLSPEELAAHLDDPANSDDIWNPRLANRGRTTPAGARRQVRNGRNGALMRDRRGRVVYETVAVAAPVTPKPATYECRYKDLYQLELREDLVFDQKRGRMYHDLKTITLLLPATLVANVSGIEKPVGVFKYNDLVRVFRANSRTALWFNAQNDAQHKNLADALELGLFSSYVTKVSNPNDSRLDDVYGSQAQGILAAYQTAADLVEYECNLWSY